ncbi:MULTISPECIES: STAS domain-containing protein [Catenuloplanes]|uniref:Anti-anti-sigma regulatory factor n=1 Tax=Catenuloplanes niger TaxID=587534 RepID=A0AAE4CR87_9ACTN|nr:STAS domain-containing protein [Catenuloplanes niger]MDR7322586.1 anti-anti-sigma regulatory factor [Catenuloplanes niger]
MAGSRTDPSLLSGSQRAPAAIDEHPDTWLDVRHVGFFGAAGIHALVRAHRHATGLGRRFGLRGVHGITEQVLAIADLEHVIPAIR